MIILGEVSATSMRESEGKHTYGASQSQDFELSTAWVEGVDGYCKTPELYEMNSSVKELLVTVNEVPYVILELEDTWGRQYFTLPEYPEAQVVEGFTLEFEILSVYPGTHYEDTCISEINMVSK